MSNYPQQTVIVQQQTNTLGVLGFCLMLIGWLTCGVLCIPSMIISGFAMFKEPKGLAIAGFVLSIPGVIMFCVLCYIFMTGVFVVGPAAKAAKEKAEQSVGP